MAFRPAMVQAILRLYSYAFHLLICLGMLAVGLVALLSQGTTFQTDFLPWEGAELRNWLLGAGIIGIVAIILAYRGKLRVLFLLYTLAVAFFVTRGVFASGYRFEGEQDFYWALAFWAGILATVLGAISRLRQPLGKL
jgi:uncharacterized membrane protein HdeD (DUF308 family)